MANFKWIEGTQNTARFFVGGNEHKWF